MEKPAPLFASEVSALSKTAECLNSAFAADPNAIHALIVNRVPCNQALIDHPQIYVDMLTVVDSTMGQATLLGVLNGVLVANGLPRVATKWTEEADEEGRRKLLGFCDYQTDVPNVAVAADEPVPLVDEAISVISEIRGLTPPYDVEERPGLVAAWSRASRFLERLRAFKRDWPRSINQTRLAPNDLEGTIECLSDNDPLANIVRVPARTPESVGLPSIEELWEIYSHLQLLRSEEASEVTFVSAHQDVDDHRDEIVEVCDLWTDWIIREFRATSLVECLRNAVEARKAWYAEQEAKRAKLLRKT